MADIGVKEEHKSMVLYSGNGHPRRHTKPRVTFKKKSKDDFITINVSGRRFQAEDAIFTKHPGIAANNFF